MAQEWAFDLELEHTEDGYRATVSQSPAGTASRRSVTLGVEQADSPVLAEFVRRARALRTMRPFTVRESAELLAELLQAVREDLATEGKV